MRLPPAILATIFMFGCCPDYNARKSRLFELKERDRILSQSAEQPKSSQTNPKSESDHRPPKTLSELKVKYDELSKEDLDFDKKYGSVKKLADNWCHNSKVQTRALKACIDAGSVGGEWGGRPKDLEECQAKNEEEFGIRRVYED